MMKLSKVTLLLLVSKAYGEVVEGPPAVTALQVPAEEHRFLDTLANHGGWVNPEDLMPMPQCIAQQDQAAWLSAMTKCSSKICINHFGPLICTRHQWLTQLTCLSVEFTPDIVKGYLQLCSRSVLAKAQLFSWVRTVTGRTWLAEVGDTIELERLSPASLPAGYAAVGLTRKAPTCLTKSISISSNESFQHAIASCSFTDTSQHTGNAARPWEYNEPRRSIIRLDSATVGYDLTGRSIWPGHYFDRNCFCDSFAFDSNQNFCTTPNQLDLTRQRLWINATCGPESLPSNWTIGLRTTYYDYIPVEDWNWPKCYTDMPKRVTRSTERCATDACEVDNDGYCYIKRTVDRSCFCNAITYDTCGGSCHVFESRIDYVHWLHGLCSEVHGWHGLPKEWRKLAAITALELIPLPWVTGSDQKYTRDSSNSFALKLATLVLLNATPFLAIFLSMKMSERFYPSDSQSAERRFLTGTSVAALNILAAILNTFLSRQIPNFEETPVYQLLLVWCSMPRLSWLAILLAIVKRPELDVSAISATLVTEWVFQVLTLPTMVQAIQYGFEHDFYTEAMKRLDGFPFAKLTYTGSLLYLITFIIALVILVRTIFEPEPKKVKFDDWSPRWKRSTVGKIKLGLMLLFKEQWAHVTKRMRLFNTYWSTLEQHIYLFLTKASHTAEHGRLPNHPPASYGTMYSTLPSTVSPHPPLRKLPVRLYSISIVSLLLLWTAKWLFWGGFLGLTSAY
ncbi:hypothetical protein BU23DRAFT_523180 [Bimuria novae-zelandiae CBS 107.79]|uniref:Extracellular membrane protein CFEM domain-containing protein n=1 Tax=Bimuria novae-zelandiae CBS 107.79 TaxID=1447943 RepID=A0A6A5VT16_9PLEO|nr:hypothetical protein BU23DRAFT_523180 [Bimuria novae-zelandiae CBS 107.79]